MTWWRLVRSEIRKLTTTKMPLGFLLALLALSAVTVTAVLLGTDADGSKGFIATPDDQRSLMATSGNAMMIAALFGAIAIAREYGHGTVVPTYLASPRRHRSVLAQLAAAMLGGAALGLVATALTIGGVAVALPLVDFSFMLSVGAVLHLLAASAFTGAVGAVLGAAIGFIVRNVGGSVVAVVLLLFILPPLVVQMAKDTLAWTPSALALIVSGVTDYPGLVSALVVLTSFATIPALLAVVAVRKRDVT